MLKKLTALALTLMFVLSVCSGAFNAIAYAVEGNEREIAEKLHLTQVQDFNGRDDVTIMVELDGDTALEKAGSDVKSSTVYTEQLLKNQASAKKSIEKVLKQEVVVKNNYTLLFNGFSFEGTVDMVAEINALPGVTAFVAPEYALPKTVASTELVNAVDLWELGYTGKGTTVAILDTGITADHEAFSVNPPAAAFDEDALEEVFDEYGEYMHAGKNVRMLFESKKIPFAYDYFLGRYGAQHISDSDHGTHVAGIAAGNNGDDFRGVAYDAQIFAMQVFTQEGGALWDNILLALEDCAYLGVDSVNMSLGSPAGFSAYAEESYIEVFNLLKTTGVAISAAAGNEGSTATDNAWGGYQLAANPDSGVVGSPSTWDGCLSIAASDNATVCNGSIEVDGKEFGYNDPFKDTDNAFDTLNGKHEYVLCGIGDVADFEGKDLEDKIAVISRGTTTFSEKAANAANAGAKAVIIYNNQDGVINMSVESDIPVISILQIHGEKLIEAADDDMGELKVNKGTFIDYDTASGISSFSSVGTTADLKIKPEITAPGGNITSSIGFGEADSYGTWSGTSMAAPHVAGGLAILMQYVEEKFPNESESKQLDIAYAILMSTARQMPGELVRSQGAGLMDLEAAVTSNAYLTVQNCDRPKIELGEIDKDSFTLKFTVNNFGEDDIEYEIDTDVLIDTPYAAGDYGEYTVYVTQFDALDVTEDCTIKADKTVKVKAGKTAKVEVKVTLSKELIKDIESIFTAGTFAEGFVTLTPKDDEEAVLSVPYLGFVGDWDYAAVLDYGYYWQDATGDYNWNSNPSIPFSYVGSSEDAEMLYGAGINPYGDGSMPAESFLYDRIAVSPDRAKLDYMKFSLLRNPKSLRLYIADDDGNELSVLQEFEDYMWRKEFSDGYSYSYSDMSFNVDFAAYEENQTVHIVLEALLDHEGFDPEKNQNAMWDIPVTIDSTAPFVTKTEYKNGLYKLEAFDTNYIASIAVYDNAELKEPVAETLYYAENRAHTEKFSFETDNDDKIIYVVVADYAGNERIYTFNTITETTTEQIDLARYSTQIPVWSDSFEDSSTYDGWEILDNDGDGSEWILANDDELASEGSIFAASFSYDSVTDSELAPDNWMISPNVSIPDDGNKYTLSFDIAAADFDETYGLYIGGENAAVSSDFEELMHMSMAGSAYKTVTFDVSEYAGETVRFAWRHFDCVGGNFLRLDNIKLYYLEAFIDDPYYTESFESNNTEWTAHDADGDDKTFIKVRNERLASDGKNAMFSKSFDTDTSTQLDVDNWLISDDIKIPSGSDLMYLTYDVISSLDMNDYYEVYVGDDDDVDDMKDMLYCGNAGNAWNRQIIDLTKYAGKTIHIGFRHVTDEGMMLGIDNIRIYRVERKAEYTVKFMGRDGKQLIGMSRYEEGSVITGFPKAYDDKDYIFTGWDYNGAPVKKDTTIYSEYRVRGDANMDNSFNTGDAVFVLRAAAFDTELTGVQVTLADFNEDGNVNTGDAAAILRRLVGLN